MLKIWKSCLLQNKVGTNSFEWFQLLIFKIGDDSLTHKEIILSGIALKPTPRLPMVILSSGVWILYRNGLSLQDTFECPPEKIAECFINNNNEADSDIIWMGADCGNLALRAIGAKCTFNALGEASTMDEPLVLKPSDVDKLKIEDLENSLELENLLKTTKIVAERVGNEFLLGNSQWGPFTLAGQLMGMENLMVTTLKDKPGIQHVLEFTESLLLKYWNLFIDAGVELVNQAEPMSSGNVISAKIFKETAFPRIKSANKAINKRAKAKMLHICGNTTKILDLIPLTETDLFSLDYQVDLKIAREKLSGKIAFGGNLNPTSIILEGTPEDIKIATTKCILDAGQKGYIVMPGCDIPPKTKMENVQAMVDTVHHTFIGCK